MIRWRVIENSLPADVRTAVLRVDELAPYAPEWKLLRSGNTRSIYRYSPPERNGQSWLIKWGHNYNFRQTCNALFGPTDADREAEAMRRALEAGIPTVPPRLTATTPLWRQPLQTILVTEFIAGSRDLFTILKEIRCNATSVKQLLSDLAELLIRIHRACIVHNDLSATNVLLKKNGELYVVDLAKMRFAIKEMGEFHRDLTRIVIDLMAAGIATRDINSLLAYYVERMDMPAQSRRIILERVPEKALAACRRIAHRASRNSIRKSRTLDRFRYGGFRVFMVKGHDALSAHRFIDRRHESPEDLDQQSTYYHHAPFWSRKESSLLRGWRMRRALHYSGLGGDEAVAFAHRFGLKREELLICSWPQDGRSLRNGLAASSTRCHILKTAGHFLRRLHQMGMNLTRFDIRSWRLCEDASGAPFLFTTDFDAFTFLHEEDLGTRFHWILQWLPHAITAGLTKRDLAVFLRAYCVGKIDRNLWAFFEAATTVEHNLD